MNSSQYATRNQNGSHILRTITMGPHTPTVRVMDMKVILLLTLRFLWPAGTPNFSESFTIRRPRSRGDMTA